MHYYNEIDPYCVAWLRSLMAAGEIPEGVVDDRSIELVQPGDLAGYTQCHFFAGIGGWPLALRLAGWPENEPIWTGSCPCQPFSAAGQRRGTDDPRHLWPHFRRLIALCGSPVVAGEQVASADGREWLAGVRTDLEALGYAVGAADLCSAGAGAPDITLGDCAAEALGGIRAALDAFGEVGSAEEIAWAVDRVARTIVGPPHIRQRLFWVADAASARLRAGLRDRESGDERRHEPGDGGSAGWLGEPMPAGLPPSEREALLGEGRRREGGATGQPGGALVRLGDTKGGGCGVERDAALAGSGRHAIGASWARFDIVQCRDEKARRFEPGAYPLVDGVSGRVGRLRGYGNAITPQVAAEFIRAYRECHP